MASGGGGGGKTQTVTQTNQPPAYLEPYVKDAAAQALHQYRENPTQVYGGQTYADMDPATQAALGLTTQRAIGGSPLVNQAQDTALATARGDFLGSNPFADAQFDQIAGAIRRNTDTAAARAGTGASTSGSYYNALADATGNAATNFYGDQYARERALQQGAVGMAPQLAGQDYMDLQALMNVGARNEQQTQYGIDEEMQRHYSQFDLPRQDLANLVSAIQGTAFGGQSTQTGPKQAGSSTGTQLLGGGLAALPFLSSMFSWSDRRLKTDVERVGVADNGLPIYRYRYIGSDTPQLGLMAQDVAMVKPEAVASINGLLAVDYEKATSA